MNNFKRLIMIITALYGLVWAQSPIELNLERFLINELEQDGESTEILSPALELQPGQMIQEIVAASNMSDTSLSSIDLVLPVPEGTFYMAETAVQIHFTDHMVAPQFSFDLGKTFSFPPLLKTITVIENGKEVLKEVEVSPKDYTHVRWLVPQLLAQEEVTASFKAVVR